MSTFCTGLLISLNIWEKQIGGHFEIFKKNSMIHQLKKNVIAAEIYGEHR